MMVADNSKVCSTYTIDPSNCYILDDLNEHNGHNNEYHLNAFQLSVVTWEGTALPEELEFFHLPKFSQSTDLKMKNALKKAPFLAPPPSTLTIEIKWFFLPLNPNLY